MKSVAVIGAGPGGLAAIKSCLDESLHPTCFEQRQTIGGLWNEEPATSEMTDVAARVYSSMVTNDDRETNPFSDFPHAKDTPMYIPAGKYLDYLNAYADHFDLKRYIQFSTKVVKVERSPDYNETGRWLVTSQRIGQNDSSPSTQTFDGVMICIGFYNSPRYPDYPGADTFSGIKLHSGEYSEPYIFKNKRVLVIGGGLSGGDMSLDISREADQIYLSTRRGFWQIPRMLQGKPVFHAILNRYANETQSFNKMDKSVAMLLQSLVPYKDLSILPRCGVVNGTISVLDGFDSKLISGKIKMKPDVQSLGPKTVTFVDGTTEEIDAIFFTVGFKSLHSFLDDAEAAIFGESCVNPRLFKHVFPPMLERGTLAFINKINPCGPQIPTVELESRMAARVIAGKLSLPSKEEMLKSAKLDMEWRRQFWGQDLERVPLYKIQNEVADFLGAKPTLARIFGMFFYDPVLAWHVLMGPSVPAVYRLFGPHAKWTQAREIILNVNENCFAPCRTVTYQQDRPTPFYKRSSFYLLIASVFSGIFLFRNIELIAGLIS